MASDRRSAGPDAESATRADLAPLDLRGRVVLLIDDGLATGSTMKAAVEPFACTSPHESSSRFRSARRRHVRSSAKAAKRARYRYSCFEMFGEDPQAHGRASSFGLSKTCEDEGDVPARELRRQALECASRDGADRVASAKYPRAKVACQP